MSAHPFKKVAIGETYKVWKNDVTMQIAVQKRNGLRLQSYEDEKEYKRDVEKWESREGRL